MIHMRTWADDIKEVARLQEELNRLTAAPPELEHHIKMSIARQGAKVWCGNYITEEGAFNVFVTTALDPAVRNNALSEEDEGVARA